MLRTTLRGVRMSWLILEKKSCLAVVASSVLSSAAASSPDIFSCRFLLREDWIYSAAINTSRIMVEDTTSR